jgi:peptidoglycan biosynthesis protein MviN/MurJ (putative lipid II flippase)
LPEHHRRAKAIAAANKYARRPNRSAFTHGLVAVILALLLLVIFGMFYGLEVLAYPAAVGAGLVPVFILGVLLRRRRRRLHGRAFDQEFGNQDNSPPA